MFVRHHRSGVQKKQDDTRQSSNGLQTRTPSTYVITKLQTNLDLRNTILSENKPNGPVSYGCKFPLVFSLPVSSSVRCRVLWRKTIGAGTRVRLGFPNVRPVRLDRSVKAFVDFIGSSPARKNKIFCFSLAYSKNSLTGGTPHSVRQTPPVGRSEKARRHSPELQWSPNTIPSDLRYHYLAS